VLILDFMVVAILKFPTDTE